MHYKLYIMNTNQINLIHEEYKNIISKNIKEIDILQDELYDLKKEIKLLIKLNNQLNNQINLRDKIINIKNKRIFKILSKYSKYN